MVRFFALHRINPHAPPLVRAPPSIPLSFSLAAVLPQAGALNALAAARNSWNEPTPSAQRLRHGLPGYLILFAPPCFRSSASVAAQRPAFAIGVPPDICAFHRYTRNSSLPLPHSSLPVPDASPRLSLGISHQTRQTAYELFTPNNSGQRLRPTYYRGCWHVVSRRFFCRYRHLRFFPAERGLQPEGRHPSRGVAASGLRPLCNIPPLLPPVGVWAVSQSQCGRSPSQAGYPSTPW